MNTIASVAGNSLTGVIKSNDSTMLHPAICLGRLFLNGDIKSDEISVSAVNLCVTKEVL